MLDGLRSEVLASTVNKMFIIIVMFALYIWIDIFVFVIYYIKIRNI
jgi:hypothetical protein